MHYRTFNLIISPTGTPHDYILTAQTSADNRAEGRCRLSSEQNDFTRLYKSLGDSNSHVDDIRNLGASLFNTFFIEDILNLWRRTLGETMEDEIGIRLQLQIDAPKLVNLPWEMLYDPGRSYFPAASSYSSLCRTINLHKPIRQIAYPKSINLLAIVASTSEMETKSEIKQLQILQQQLSPLMTFDILDAPATQEAVRLHLQEKEYHIVHYSGHGSVTDQTAHFDLDRSEQNALPLTAEAFAHLLANHPSLRLIILNAFQGAALSSQEVLMDIARRLVFGGLPAAIAVRNPMTHADTLLFAKALYTELCQNGRIDAAVSSARKALLQENPQTAAFAAPALFLRGAEGHLWDMNKAAAPQVANKEKKSFLDHWQKWVVLIGTLFAILGAVLDLPAKLAKLSELRLSNKKIIASRTIDEPRPQILEGQIVDENGAPIEGVKVYLPEYDKTIITNDWGKYKFEIIAPADARVKLQAQKTGYEILNQDPALGGKPDTFQMHPAGIQP